MNIVSQLHQPSKRFRTPPGSLRRAALLILALAVASTGCGGGDATTSSQEARTYAVRGVVRGLSQSSTPRPELSIRHEAIDDFVDIQGRVVGMDSMTMPFPVADGESLADLGPGDAVQFELVVDWNGSPPVVIRQLKKLDAGTELEFREAQPTPQ